MMLTNEWCRSTWQKSPLDSNGGDKMQGTAASGTPRIDKPTPLLGRNSLKLSCLARYYRRLRTLTNRDRCVLVVVRLALIGC